MSFPDIPFAPSVPSPISTPCIGICTLGADGLCDGCLRSGEEIAAWSILGEPERRHIMDTVLPARRAAIGQ